MNSSNSDNETEKWFEMAQNAHVQLQKQAEECLQQMNHEDSELLLIERHTHKLEYETMMLVQREVVPQPVHKVIDANMFK